MTGFVLKIIGIITMVIDHLRYVMPFWGESKIVFLGRLSFPIFAFLIVQGYKNTHNIKKYWLRLLLFSLVSQYPHDLLLRGETLNIGFTFLFAISGLIIFDYLKKKIKNRGILYSLIIIIWSLLCIIGELINISYGWFGLVIIWFWFIFSNFKVISFFGYIIIVAIYYLSRGLNIILLTSMIITMIAGSIVLLYNGKEGKKMQMFFYIFYPLQFIILVLIRYIFF